MWDLKFFYPKVDLEDRNRKLIWNMGTNKVEITKSCEMLVIDSFAFFKSVRVQSTLMILK